MQISASTAMFVAAVGGCLVGSLGASVIILTGHLRAMRQQTAAIAEIEARMKAILETIPATVDSIARLVERLERK
mgnify:FL=1